MYKMMKKKFMVCQEEASLKFGFSKSTMNLNNGSHHVTFVYFINQNFQNDVI